METDCLISQEKEKVYNNNKMKWKEETAELFILKVSKVEIELMATTRRRESLRIVVGLVLTADSITGPAFLES